MKNMYCSLLIILLIINGVLGGERERDDSFLMFPFSADRLAAGNTYSGSPGDYGDPGFLHVFDPQISVLTFSTFLIPGDVRLYYTSYNKGNILLDVYYNDWGMIETRDESGISSGEVRTYEISFFSGYRFNLKSVDIAAGARLTETDLAGERTSRVIPCIMAAYGESIVAGGAVWMSEGLSYSLHCGVDRDLYEIRLGLRKYSSGDAISLHGGIVARPAEHLDVTVGWGNDKLTGGISAYNRQYGVTYGIMFDEHGYSVNAIELKIRI